MIRLHEATRRYTSTERPALDRLSLEIPSSGLTAITGPSGSGKSTLFNVIAGLDRLDEGAVSVDGVALEALSNAELARWRARSVGLVFQSFLLLENLSASENVIAPMEFIGSESRASRGQRAAMLLERLGLGGHRRKYPSQLSGGQQQRVAIARALANDPPLVLADEPTGNLDTSTGREVLSLLRSLADDGRGVIIITHDAAAAALADRIVHLVDGRVAEPCEQAT